MSFLSIANPEACIMFKKQPNSNKILIEKKRLLDYDNHTKNILLHLKLRI